VNGCLSEGPPLPHSSLPTSILVISNENIAHQCQVMQPSFTLDQIVLLIIILRHSISNSPTPLPGTQLLDLSTSHQSVHSRTHFILILPVASKNSS
jgi:hypothetical protein